MNMVLLGLLVWINSTGMITPVDPVEHMYKLPEVVRVDDRGMAEQLNRCLLYLEPELIALTEKRFGRVTLASYKNAMEHAQSVNGVYCAGRISMKNDLDLDGEHRYALLHELVHWMQEYNGDRTEAIRGGCLLHVERDAYAIHHRWQEENGQELFPDKFTAHMRSICTHELIR